MPLPACPVCRGNKFSTVLRCRDYFVSSETFEVIECSQCKMRMTKDFPDDKSIGRYYETTGYISHSDTKKGIVNTLYHQVRKRMLRKKAVWIEENSGLKTGKLLDVGTGTGYFAGMMKERGWDVSVIEKNDAARGFAEKNFQLSAYPTTDDLIEKKAPEFTGKIDIITLWHVLEHIEQLNESLSQFFTLLKPGGTLTIAVPNCDSYDARKYKNVWAAYDVPRHLWHFRKEQMEILAGKHGFHISGIKKMPFDAFYISMMSEKYAGHSFPFIRGMVSGITGFISSIRDNTRSSSLVYFLTKK